jgi:transcriptional regulator with XRE-family HTH domain
MRVWNWELFKKLVRTKEAAGVPLSEQATALEVSHSTLQGYLDQRDRPPSKRMLELAPGYYRVKLDDLWVQSGLTDEAIEIQRARSMLLDCMNSDEASAMSDSEALSWYRFAKSTLLLAKNNTNKQG